MKEESAKAGLHLSKKTKVMTREELDSFNIDNGCFKIVKGFASLGSVTKSKRDCSQDIKRRMQFRREAMEELVKTTQSKNVSSRGQG